VTYHRKPPSFKALGQSALQRLGGPLTQDRGLGSVGTTTPRPRLLRLPGAHPGRAPLSALGAGQLRLPRAAPVSSYLRNPHSFKNTIEEGIKLAECQSGNRRLVAAGASVGRAPAPRMEAARWAAPGSLHPRARNKAVMCIPSLLPGVAQGGAARGRLNCAYQYHF
jgi:hypothetical protein